MGDNLTTQVIKFSKWNVSIFFYNEIDLESEQKNGKDKCDNLVEEKSFMFQIIKSNRLANHVEHASYATNTRNMFMA